MLQNVKVKPMANSLKMFFFPKNKQTDDNKEIGLSFIKRVSHLSYSYCYFYLSVGMLQDVKVKPVANRLVTQYLIYNRWRVISNS